MLFIVILELLLIAGMAVAVLRDEKADRIALRAYLGDRKKNEYRVPLRVVVRKTTEVEPKQTPSGPRHRYVNP